MPSSSRFAALDVIRGLAATSVFLTHWLIWNRVGFDPAIAAGPATLEPASSPHGVAMWIAAALWRGAKIHPGVVCFIVLSGFCIHLPLANSSGNSSRPGFWRQYAIRRGCRVVPVYWIALLLGAALIAVLRTMPPSTWPAFLGPEIQTVDWTALLLSVPMIPAGAVRTGPVFPGNGPLATVAVEALLYLTYPALVSLRRRLGSWAIWLTAAGMYSCYVLLRFAAGGAAAPHLTGTYFEFLLYWIIGAAAAECYVRFHSERHLRVSAIVAICILGFAPAYNVLACWLPSALQVTKALMLAIVTGCLLHLVMVYERIRGESQGAAARALTGSLRRIGEASYSLYAIHTPILGAALAVAASGSGQVALVWRCAAAIAVMAAAAVLHRFVERPSMQFAKNMAHRLCCPLPVVASCAVPSQETTVA